MITEAPVQRPQHHCTNCGQPVSRENWLRITYAYRGADASYLACPACLTTQLLLPAAPHPPSDAGLS